MFDMLICSANPGRVLAGMLRLAGLACPPIRAQDTGPLRPGDRLRVYSGANYERTTGDLLSVDGSALLVLSRGTTLEFDVRDVRRLERRTGRVNHMGRGALIGGGVGFALGGAFGVIPVNGLCDKANGCGGDIPKARCSLAESAPPVARRSDEPIRRVRTRASCSRSARARIACSTHPPEPGTLRAPRP